MFSLLAHEPSWEAKAVGLPCAVCLASVPCDGGASLRLRTALQNFATVCDFLLKYNVIEQPSMGPFGFRDLCRDCLSLVLACDNVLSLLWTKIHELRGMHEDALLKLRQRATSDSPGTSSYRSPSPNSSGVETVQQLQDEFLSGCRGSGSSVSVSDADADAEPPKPEPEPEPDDAGAGLERVSQRSSRTAPPRKQSKRRRKRSPHTTTRRTVSAAVTAETPTSSPLRVKMETEPEDFILDSPPQPPGAAAAAAAAVVPETSLLKHEDTSEEVREIQCMARFAAYTLLPDVLENLSTS